VTRKKSRNQRTPKGGVGREFKQPKLSLTIEDCKGRGKEV